MVGDEPQVVDCTVSIVHEEKVGVVVRLDSANHRIVSPIVYLLAQDASVAFLALQLEVGVAVLAVEISHRLVVLVMRENRVITLFYL